MTRLLALLGVGLALTCTTVGCDQLSDLAGDEKSAEEDEDKDDEDEDEDDDAKKKKKKRKKKKKSEDDEESTDDKTEEAPESKPEPAVELTRYPDQKTESGDFKTLVPLTARKAAEDSGAEMMSLPSGTVVSMKATHGEWSLVEFDQPSDTVVKEQGWIHALPTAKDKLESTGSDPAPDPEPTQPQPTQPQPTQPQPTQPQPTQPQPTQPQPSAKPTATPTAAPKSPLNPCGCKVGDMVCLRKCLQNGGKR